MAGALSKRQQARNEKQLTELVQNVPGNNICADCHTRNPGTGLKVSFMRAATSSAQLLTINRSSQLGHHGVSGYSCACAVLPSTGNLARTSPKSSP
jgi:hypothetical protein